MSQVLLLAADEPLPLCDCQQPRTTTVAVGSTEYAVEFAGGFCVREHTYYRDAVEALSLTMKPWRYELELEAREDDLADLRAYLAEHCKSGSEVELWNLWVGDDAPQRVPSYRGKLADFDLEALRQLLSPSSPDGGIGQCRMTVVI